jgi:hypothetical protein
VRTQLGGAGPRRPGRDRVRAPAGSTHRSPDGCPPWRRALQYDVRHATDSDRDRCDCPAGGAALAMAFKARSWAPAGRPADRNAERSLLRSDHDLYCHLRHCLGGHLAHPPLVHGNDRLPRHDVTLPPWCGTLGTKTQWTPPWTPSPRHTPTTTTANSSRRSASPTRSVQDRNKFVPQFRSVERFVPRPVPSHPR